MQLIFLYGPPAVGKLTIAKELSRLTSIPLADNHSLVNPIAQIFGWDHPERSRLGHEFRIELFRSAARAGKSLITTFGGGGETYDDFIQEAKKVVEDNGGQIIFVHLIASKDVLLQRVHGDSRSAHLKMTTTEALLKQLEGVPDVFAGALVGEHLEIDTSEQSPEESAGLILAELKR
ncbi:MAG: AAA family ATPase [Patescibacteria group bacterium]|jgi:shikimate kinase